MAFLAAKAAGGRRGCDDVHLEPNQLVLAEAGQAIGSAFRESVFDDEVLALDPPEIAQPLAEHLED